MNRSTIGIVFGVAVSLSSACTGGGGVAVTTSTTSDDPETTGASNATTAGGVTMTTAMTMTTSVTGQESSTSMDATSAGDSSGTGGADGSSGGSGGSESGSGSSTGDAGIDCEFIELAPGPLPFEEVFAEGVVFSGSEDIVFDGQGNMAGKSGNTVVLVDASGGEVESYPDNGGTYGLRYRTDGDLLAAKHMTGQIRVLNGDGGTLLTMLGGVNGLYPDLEGNVWFTNFSVVRRLNADDSVDVIVDGPDSSSVNGVVFDPDRGLLFYTDYSAGLIRSVEIGADGAPGAVSMVASIPGASLDGLSLDACGNIYAVDQGGSALWRVFVDVAGVGVGDPEVLVEQFPSNVANAIFGEGEGWDELSLYVGGVPGGVYRVEIGLEGAPTAVTL